MNERVLFPVPALQYPVHRFAHTEVDFRTRVLVMAVVNRTPDSFYDAGATFTFDAAVDAARAAAAMASSAPCPGPCARSTGATDAREARAGQRRIAPWDVP